MLRRGWLLPTHGWRRIYKHWKSLFPTHSWCWNYGRWRGLVAEASKTSVKMTSGEDYSLRLVGDASGICLPTHFFRWSSHEYIKKFARRFYELKLCWNHILTLTIQSNRKSKSLSFELSLKFVFNTIDAGSLFVKADQVKLLLEGKYNEISILLKILSWFIYMILIWN